MRFNPNTFRFSLGMVGYRRGNSFLSHFSAPDSCFGSKHSNCSNKQILTLADFGESHYIGPLDDKQYLAFDQDHGKSPYNYAKDMPHDGWRTMLPFVIEMYKNNQSTITQEKLTTWYRKSSNIAPLCSSGGTTGNTASKCMCFRLGKKETYANFDSAKSLWRF